MNKLIALLALVLAACGGGAVNCTAQSACVYNITVQGDVNAGSLPASAPAPAASSASSPGPAASQPSTPTVPAVPLAKLKSTFPVHAIPGDLRWTAGGMTYVVAVVTNGEAAWVALYSAGSTGDDVPMPNVEAMLDSGLDLRGLSNADDATLKAYVAERIVPKLDAWMQANSSRFESGMQFPAVNRTSAPTGGYMERLAGRLPQWLDVTPFGAAMK